MVWTKAIWMLLMNIWICAHRLLVEDIVHQLKSCRKFYFILWMLRFFVFQTKFLFGCFDTSNKYVCRHETCSHQNNNWLTVHIFFRFVYTFCFLTLFFYSFLIWLILLVFRATKISLMFRWHIFTHLKTYFVSDVYKTLFPFVFMWVDRKKLKLFRSFFNFISSGKNKFSHKR